MKKSRSFTLSGQEIKWYNYYRVVHLSGSHENAQRFFLRACAAKAKDITGYIMAGIGRGGYIWQACKLEYDKPKQCAKWIEKTFASAKPGPQSAKVALVAELERMLAEAKNG